MYATKVMHKGKPIGFMVNGKVMLLPIIFSNNTSPDYTTVTFDGTTAVFSNAVVEGNTLVVSGATINNNTLIMEG